MVLFALAAALAGPAAAFPCPPMGFDSVHNFDVAKYTRGPWYAQLQVKPFFRGLRGAAQRPRAVRC